MHTTPAPAEVPLTAALLPGEDSSILKDNDGCVFAEEDDGGITCNHGFDLVGHNKARFILFESDRCDSVYASDNPRSSIQAEDDEFELQTEGPTAQREFRQESPRPRMRKGAVKTTEAYVSFHVTASPRKIIPSPSRSSFLFFFFRVRVRTCVCGKFCFLEIRYTNLGIITLPALD